ncbi:uncharacterized protein [Cicer arietinum]|uniref:Uncharacterized protein LOC101492327 isoform X2 n=1 Tax=Cicer arietinum TaxID=3827 RepID=A0A1S3E6F2_CICAR|nr:uncharacterized protein LOC101492327 isoform X2 [Cicer arietinum]
MAATSESINENTFSLPVIDLRLISQPELFTISLSHDTARNRRIDDDTVIPKIDRSVFNESAGSRKQTFSRLRLRDNNKQYSSVPVTVPVPAPVSVSSSSSSHIPADEENSRIIDLLQQLFGVEGLRGANDDRLVPVPVEFKQPDIELTPLFAQEATIEGVDGSQKKRKRGRPRRSETPVPMASVVVGKVKENAVETVEEMAVESVNKKNVENFEEKKGFVLDDVGDPFVEELIGRTQGMNTEPQLLEFLEGLNGVWGSDRKKRRIVDANALCDLLPTGWKLVLTLMRRGTRAYVVCRRYVSPDGRPFESYKDASLSSVQDASLSSVQDTYLSGVQDISHLNGSHQLSSNTNMAPQSSVGHAPTGGLEINAHASSHHEKHATISSSIGTEKLDTFDANFNSSLALDCKLGDTSGAIKVSDHQVDDKQPLKADKNVRNAELVGARDAACNLYIPSVFTAPISNNSCGIDNFSEGSAVTCIKGGVGIFDSQDKSTGHDTVPYGNERVHVGANGIGHSVSLVEDHIPKIGSEGKVVLGSNLEDIHSISSLADIEKNDGKLVKDDSQQIVSAEGNFFYNDLPNSSINERMWDHSEYISNNSFNAWPQDASESCGVDFTPNLYVANDVSDNHVLPMDEVATSCLQKKSNMNDQTCTMDNMLHRSSESNIFTSTGNQHPSAFHDNMNNISGGTFGPLKHVDAGCMKPQLGIVSGSDVAINAYASPRVMQGKSQSVPTGGSMLNQFDKPNDGVNKENKSCLSEMAKSENEIFQTDSMDMPKFR